jgi:hypothetical protein
MPRVVSLGENRKQTQSRIQANIDPTVSRLPKSSHSLLLKHTATLLKWRAKTDSRTMPTALKLNRRKPITLTK